VRSPAPLARRSKTATRAPPDRRRSTVAAPIPPAPPVTSAISSATSWEPHPLLLGGTSGRARRPPDRNRHVPLHGRRGLDQASARAWRGEICGCSHRAPPRRAGGVPSARRGRGGHTGRCVLRRLPDCGGCARGRGRDHERARNRTDPRAHGGAHRDAARDGRGVRGRRRPLRRPGCSLRPRRPDCRLRRNGGAGRAKWLRARGLLGRACRTA